MPNPIDNANYLAKAAIEGRNLDTKRQNAGERAADAQRPPTGEDAPALDRAQQRLVQEAEADGATTGLTSLEQARERVQALRQQIANDPQAALRAHAGIDATQFSAATARPNAA
ncbi:MAG: hypothetical protein H6955_03950 [Chromatiaceae bacterium]|nr:hypothetical protein [Chromatiaceae bacterium]